MSQKEYKCQEGVAGKDYAYITCGRCGEQEYEMIRIEEKLMILCRCCGITVLDIKIQQEIDSNKLSRQLLDAV